MVDVIILCAGASSRFPNSRPKWLLTHPNGKYLFQRSVEGLRGEKSVHLAVLREHLEQQTIPIGELRNLVPDMNLVIFDKPTASQAASAQRALEMIEPKGPVFFKDCDSYFIHQLVDHNHVVVGQVENDAPLDFASKCFVQSDNVGRITNIVEKKIISHEFAIGGYGFNNAQIFSNAFKACPNQLGELYLSHVVLSAMLQGQVFTSVPGLKYEDYGTPAAFRAEVAKYGTIFVDLDGTLLKSAGRLGPVSWGHGAPIPENIAEIARLYATGRYRIVITTARPSSLYGLTIAELAAHKIPCHQVMMDCLHAPRLIINDRGPNSPPMALSGEIERDSPRLQFWTGSLK